MAELLSGGREEDLPLPVSEPARDSLAPIKSRLYKMAFTASQIAKAV